MRRPSGFIRAISLCTDPTPARAWCLPLTRQVLGGVDEITVSLIEAGHEVDTGPIYGTGTIRLTCDEFIDELRAAQWSVPQRLRERSMGGRLSCSTGAEPQKDSATYYSSRRPAKSHLELEKTPADQIRLLRVVDNHRCHCYPEFAGWRGKGTTLEARPKSDESSS